MLTATLGKAGSAVTARLSGVIDETTLFDKLIGPLPPELHVYTKEVSRINSVGVKAWMIYFGRARTTKSVLKFFECSTAIVEQLNNFSNFSCGGTVESIYVPFTCETCHSELIGLFKTADLKKMNFKVPEPKCARCSGKSVFDDIPEHYFGFLKK